MKALIVKSMPVYDGHLTAEIQALFIPINMRTAACEVLTDIQSAQSREELDRSSTFANGFILGVDLNHIWYTDVLSLQAIYCSAYETRRDQIATA